MPCADGHARRFTLELRDEFITNNYSPSPVLLLSWHADVKKVACNQTPIILNAAARSALLRSGVGTAESEILAIRAHSRRPALTSSPLNPTTGATEGAQYTTSGNPLDLEHQQPVSIAASANRLAQETAKIHEAKIAVFKAFCAAFDETANSSPTGLPSDLRKSSRKALFIRGRTP